MPSRGDVLSIFEPVYASPSVQEADISRAGFGSPAIVGHGVDRQIDTTIAIGRFPRALIGRQIVEADELGSAEPAWHDGAMSDNETNIHPYTLEVLPPKDEGANYNWAIRKHGKLAQRSDRSYPTEAKAHAAGMATVEKLLSGSDR